MKNKNQYLLSIIAILISAFTLQAQIDTLAKEEMPEIKEAPNAQEETIIDGKNVKIILKEKKVASKTEDGKDTVTSKVESFEIVPKDRAERKANEDDPVEDFEVVKEPDFIETDWNNFQLGLNNLINSEGNLDGDAGFENMEVSPANSINFQWNIVTQAMNIYKGKVRLVYGVGLDFNNYRFKDDITLSGDSVPLFVSEDGTDYKRNKLVTQHINVPVMLNFRLAPPKANDYVYISAGANFGYLIGSHQRQIWNDGGRKKNKIEDDFNLRPFRMGYEVQFGYKNVVLFGKYFPESIFKQDEGPELRTVSAGILIGKI